MVSGRGSDELATSVRNGLRASIRNNYTAYGFSVMITASFGVAVIHLGQPTTGEVFLFLAGAVSGFTAVEAIVSGGFRHGVRGEPSDVVALGTAFSLVSTALALGTATLTTEVLGAWPAWLLAPFAATCTYIVGGGIELAAAERIKRGRGGG